MLKLRFSKPSIKTYQEGRVTVCKYNCTIINGSNNTVKKSFTVTGTSKCAPSDNLDADLGRKLADSRAKFNAYKLAVHIVPDESMDAMLKAVKESINLLCFIESMRHLKKRELLHIQKLCK